MEINDATTALSALAHPSRLETFRRLVKAGHDGLAAGDIATALTIPNNTLSTHLKTLVTAGLLIPERRGRSIVYRVDFDGARALLTFLLEDCCQGSRAVCAPAVDSAMRACCTPA